jgi:hypothetical protein
MADQYSAEEIALANEFDAIRQNYGKSGVVEHYLKAHKLLWPEDGQHRWLVLGLTRICENKITCFLGAASTNKTYIFTVHALINFWVFPHTSLGILSTTDIISLERKVWGRLKKMFNRGRERFPWLEGFVLDSKRQITPDDIDGENEVARTLDHGIGTVACVSGGRFVGMGKFQGSKPPNSPGKTDGIMVHYGDECFPAGTMIDTPSGKIPIEKLKTGDSVFSAIGVSKIKATMSRTVEGLVKIRLKDGREIICTPNHRFFTQEGWKNSLHMNQSSYMLSTYEAMQILRNELPTREQQQVLPALPRKNDLGNLRSMRNYVHKNSHCFDQEILQSLLRVEIAPSKSRIQEEILHDISLRENLVVEAQAIFGASRGICRHAEKDGGRISGVQKIAFAGGKEENQHFNIQTSEINRPQAEDSRRKRDWPNQGGGGFIGSVFPSCEEQFSNQDGNEGGKWISNLLQARFGVSRNQAGGGSGRSIPFKTGQAISRCEENELSHGSWVDSIEVLEQEGFGGHSKCERGVKVYNLEIEGHPSYSVNGLLAHNCAVMAPTFLDAYANWMVNDGFKGVMGGNPTDISDPLCTAAEPKGGWDSFIDSGKTQEWTSRWYDAHVICFDGRDTPNNDEPKNRFPYLITQKFIDLMASTHGVDSWQYFQQAIGKPSKNMVSNRVITIGLCEKHKAFDYVAWKGTPRTKIYALDPAYGGGDRCVGGECEYGEDKDGNQIFAVGSPEIIPIRLNDSLDAESQIATFIFNQHKRLNIPPENIFYDSFGRGTLGAAFAKLFGFNCPVPVDSGARPTDRPVRFDLFVDEKNGMKRLKMCNEHYSKFVTEMWYSTREAIESNQVRNLPMNVAQEGQLRLFRTVMGNKIEVESKDDMKERVKKSPDLYDWFAVALEGARRLGFKIERIGREVAASKQEEDWFDKEANDWHDAIHAGLLKH